MRDLRRKLRRMVFGSRVSLKWKITFILGFILFIVLIIGAVIYKFQPEQSIVKCTDPKCRNAAITIRKFIDPKSDPCDDFHSFVCGHFHKQAHYETAPLEKMKHNMERTLRNIVTEPMSEEEERKMCVSARKLRKYYKMCTNLGKIDGDRDAYFIKAYRSIARGFRSKPSGDEDINWHDLTLYAANQGAFSKFFLNVTTRFQRIETKHFLHIEPVSTEYLKWAKPLFSKENIRKLLGAIQMNWKLDVEDKGKVVDDLNDFFGEIQSVSFANLSNDAFGAWSRRLTTYYLDSATALYFNSDWAQFLTDLTGLPVTDTDMILNGFRSKDAFNKLLHVLSPKRNKTWQLYVIFTMIYEDCEYLSKEIRHVCSDILRTAWPLDYPKRTREDFCYHEATAMFPSIAEREYIVKVVPESKRRKVQLLTRNIIKTMLKLIDDSTDLLNSPSHRKSFTNYMKRIGISAGWHHVVYREPIFEYHYGYGMDDLANNIIEARFQMKKEKANKDLEKVVQTNKYMTFMDLGPIKLSVDAYYDTANYAIVLWAPLLTSPIYDDNIPTYLNYASLGPIIANLLLKMLQSEFLLLDVEGYSSNVPWMKKLLKARFNDQKCIQEEYGRYSHTSPGPVSQMTLQEISPPIQSQFHGTFVSQRAYENRTDSIEDTDLEELLGYTRPQLFWIMSSLYLCNDLKFELAENLNYTDYNPASFQYPAVPSYLINAPKMNLLQFSIDFGCSLNDRMNQRLKCDF